MNHKVYSIRDIKGEVFSIPFLQKTPGEAERSFTEFVNDPSTMMGKYPEDFALYELGNFDDKLGRYELHDTPLHRIDAIQVKRKLN